MGLEKSEIRKEIWTKMEEKDIARFPRPVEGRIPNFEGSRRAASQLNNLEKFQEAKRIKVNPDSPQHPVRAKIIKEGKILYMPTPRLREGFLRIKPENVPDGKEKKATTIKHSKKFGGKIKLKDIEEISLVVAGSVAVTKEGKRLGKGGGYSDLEYAILRELELGTPPVVTTVHPIQIVEEIPTEQHDVQLDCIVTPSQIIDTENKSTPPSGIDWDLIEDEDLEKIPILQELS